MWNESPAHISPQKQRTLRLFCIDIILMPNKYSSQHLKWIKKVNQSCPKTRTLLGFRTTLMKGFDPLQMLTPVHVPPPPLNVMYPVSLIVMCFYFAAAQKPKEPGAAVVARGGGVLHAFIRKRGQRKSRSQVNTLKHCHPCPSPHDGAGRLTALSEI